MGGPLRDYLQELERDFSGGGLEFMDEDNHTDEDIEVRSRLLLKKLRCEELRHQAVGEEQGRVRGRRLAALEAGLLAQEGHLEQQHHQLTQVTLAAVKTHAAPLQRARQQLPLWAPPMMDEYQSLIDAIKALSPTATMEELEGPVVRQHGDSPRHAGSDDQGAHDKKRARIVVCGNRLEAIGGRAFMLEVAMEQPFHLLGKAGAMSWEVATMDVKTAFLLAPREDTDRKLAIVKPLKILAEAGIVGPKELWKVQHALYSLRSSPADWASFRNKKLKTFQWQQGDQCLELRESTEPKFSNQEEPRLKGFIGVYVGDFIIVGARTRSRVLWEGLNWSGSGARLNRSTAMVGRSSVA